jgi:hypothetical protein
MHQHERVDSSLGNQCRRDNGFAEGRRRRQNAAVMLGQRIDCDLLLTWQGTQKAAVETRATFSQVLDISLDAMRA